MKRNLTIKLLSLILILGYSTGHAGAFQSKKPENQNAEKVLSEVYAKLEHIGSLRYDYLLELNYASESYRHTLTSKAFIDFSSPDSILGFRYQMETDDYTQIYNGTESFTLDKKLKSLKFTPNPKPTDFSSFTVFNNSLVTLRKTLPAIIADKSIGKSLADTSIAHKGYYLVNLVLNKRTIGRLGGFSALTTERDITYKIIIDKGSLMPFQVIQGNSINSDYAKTIFSNIETNPKVPSDLSWFYSSYLKEYRLTSSKALEPIKPEALAPGWDLPLVSGKQTLKLSQYRGKVVLLEFWIKNCGYCISAVPTLNALVEKFPEGQFQVVGINTHDTEADIDRFNKKNRPLYKSVFNGSKVAEAYGIEVYPSVVLLDKGGKVIYAGAMDKDKIESLIKGAF